MNATDPAIVDLWMAVHLVENEKAPMAGDEPERLRGVMTKVWGSG